MKNFIWIICLIGALSHTACTDVYFKQPQPEGLKARKSIPKQFRGMYVKADGEDSLADTSILGINFYQQIEYHAEKLTFTEIDSTPAYRLEGNQLIAIDEEHIERRYPCKISGDTATWWMKDEQFLGLSDSLIYKSYKGHHFLNIREDDGWIVMLMNKNDVGDLIFTSVTKDDIKEIEKITDATPIIKSNGNKVDYYLLDPSCKELLKMVNAGLFHDEGMVLEEKYRVRMLRE